MLLVTIRGTPVSDNNEYPKFRSVSGSVRVQVPDQFEELDDIGYARYLCWIVASMLTTAEYIILIIWLIRYKLLLSVPNALHDKCTSY